MGVALSEARSIRTTDRGCYYYCERSGSFWTTKAEQTLLDDLDAYNRILDRPESAGNHDLYLRARNGVITYMRLYGKARASATRAAYCTENRATRVRLYKGQECWN